MAESTTTNIFTDMRDASTQSYEASNKAFVDFFRSDNKMERLGDSLKAYAPSLKGAATTVAKVAATPFALVGAAYDVYAAPHVQPKIDTIKSKANAGLGAASAFIGARVDGARNFVNNVRAAIDENRGVSAISKNTGLHKDEILAGLSGKNMQQYYAEQYMMNQLNNPTQGFASNSHKSMQEYIDGKMADMARYHGVSRLDYTLNCDKNIEQSLESVGLHKGDTAALYVGKRDWSQSKGSDNLTLDDTASIRDNGTAYAEASPVTGAVVAGVNAAKTGSSFAEAKAEDAVVETTPSKDAAVDKVLKATEGKEGGFSEFLHTVAQTAKDHGELSEQPKVLQLGHDDPYMRDQGWAKGAGHADVEAAMASAVDTVSSTAQRISDKVTPVEQDKSEPKLDTEMNF